MGGVKKHELKRILRKTFRLSNWKLALITALLAFWCATLLRFDYISMSKMRDAVLTSDQEQDDEKIAENLQKLRDFTRGHIIFNYTEKNGDRQIVFGTGPFYLGNQYLRVANTAIKQAKEEIDKGSTENPNGNIFARVAEYCDAWGLANGFDYPDQQYLNCWTEKLAEYPANETMGTTESARIPSKELFRYDFASPVWYPCLSGIFIAITLILFFIVVVRFVYWLVLRIAILFIK